MFPPDLLVRAAELIVRYRSASLMVATAESCTGGLIAGLLTEIPGSSNVVERGFVVYSNAAKEELLGVPASTLARYGAVSEETARAMAEGALESLARRRRGQRHRRRRAGRRDGGEAGRPRPFRLRAARRGHGRAGRAVRRHRPRRRAPRLGRVGLDLLEAAAQ